VKAEWPDLPVVMGGPHASSNPDLVTGDPAVDAVVLGEGEETFTEVVRRVVAEGPHWRDPEVLREVAGLAFRIDGACERTRARPPIQDLDSLPFPAWDLIDYRRFWTRVGISTGAVRPYMTMLTSRGCPYDCVFCHHYFGREFRGRSPESVAAEVAEIRRRGMDDLDIIDDIVNFDPERFERMLTLFVERDLHPVLNFPSGVRGDLLRDEWLDLLQQVGVGEVSIAVETSSARLQKLLRKRLALDRVRHAIDAMAERRIFTRGFFMLGFPSETAEEMRETIRFAHASRLHLAMFFVPTPFRNTRLYWMLDNAGRLPTDVRAIDFEFFGSPFNGSEVPDPLYRKLYSWAYRGFYLDPVRMYRIARDRPMLADIPLRMYSLFRNNLSFRRVKED
jgi:radical SAM superfamily enzyme YgiQ (UPF0313 family)